MRWTATAAATASYDGPLREYLAEIASGDLVVRLDDSVDAVEPLGGGRYHAAIAPLRLPGVAVEPVARLCVERTEGGLRYATEAVELTFSGPFRRLVSGLRVIDVEACTELRADAGRLVATGDFALTMPLPPWWPVPDAAMARVEALIRAIVEKDTRLTVERISAEYEAWRCGGRS